MSGHRSWGSPAKSPLGETGHLCYNVETHPQVVKEVRVTTLDASFRRQLERSESRTSDAIVRVSIPVEEARALLEARGVRVRRTLRLIQGLAVSAPGRTLLALAAEPWVQRIEPDLPVHTQTS